MCRIAGILSKMFTEEELNTHIRKMTKVIEHGGPDDEGFYVNYNKGLALGHRRLSLLDLTSAGHQPMLNDERDLGLVFNGEIYNYLEIKSQLIKKGYNFKSNSDTEVILKAFALWGENSFKYLKGMFAFALFDLKNGSIYLVRDPQGIKPLYYYHQNGTLAFASELRAIKQLPLDLKRNKDWPVLFLSFGHLPEPETTYENIKMLPKGCFLKYSLSDISLVPRITSYTDNYLKPLEDKKDSQKIFDQTLDHAIKSQLVADAKVGVFLSGGIDSSLLALRAAKYQENNLLTVSLHFPEIKFSEKYYQDIVSKRLPGEHITKEISRKDFDLYFEQILEAMDQPSTDGINSWFVSKAAHDAGLKAVLSGIGADELFGGYPSFKRIDKIPLLRKTYRFAPFLAKLGTKEAIQRIQYLKYTQNSAFEYLFLRGFYSPDQLASLFHTEKERLINELQKLDEPEIEKPVRYNGKRASWFEQHYFMQNQLLKDADAMSMQHGLEIRVPFLDPDLIALAQTWPNDILYDKKKPAKHLLINAFDNVLPKEIWDRPKMGFTFPFQEWLKEHRLYKSLKSTYAQQPKMTGFFKSFEQNQVHWSKIMSLIVMQKFGNKDVE